MHKLLTSRAIEDNLSFSSIVARVEGWLATYMLPPFDGSNGIGGPIATYWASSPYMAGPYVMNSYGVIRGLCSRAGDENAEEARARAEKLALYYLRSQDPTTGLFVCSWGETPFVRLGLVQQASVVAALWDLHRVWPNKELAEAAEKGWRACLQHPATRNGWTVHNQALRACEALILKIWARGDARPLPDERALLQRIGQQVVKAQWPDSSAVAGALSQSLSDDRVIMPYQGKCLTPLVMLAEILEDSLYLEVALRLARFILSAMAHSRLLPGEYIPQGRGVKQTRRFYSLRHILPKVEPWLRQYRRQNISGWRFNPWPKWIARGLDTARGLYHLGRAVGEELYTQAAIEMVREVLRYQSPLGGLRNTLGFFGEDPEVLGGLVWQDVVPIPRWNSYAVQFLHELAVGTRVLPPAQLNQDSRDEVELVGGKVLVETIKELCLLGPDGREIWRLNKGKRWARPFRLVSEWDERAAATYRRVPA